VEQRVQSIIFTGCRLRFFSQVIWGNLYSLNKLFNICNYLEICVLFGLCQLLRLQHRNAVPHCEGCAGKYSEIRNFEAGCLLFVTSSFLLWEQVMEILKYVISCCFSTGSYSLVQCTNFIVLIYWENIQYLIFFLFRG